MEAIKTVCTSEIGPELRYPNNHTRRLSSGSLLGGCADRTGEGKRECEQERENKHSMNKGESWRMREKARDLQWGYCICVRLGLPTGTTFTGAEGSRERAIQSFDAHHSKYAHLTFLHPCKTADLWSFWLGNASQRQYNTVKLLLGNFNPSHVLGVCSIPLLDMPTTTNFP